MNRSRLLTFLALGLPQLLLAQVTLMVDAIPAQTPSPVNIYLAGTVNNWNPGHAAYRLALDSLSQHYYLNLPAATGTLKFKFTRGSWATVEGDANGQFIPDRSFVYGSADTLRVQIAGWEDLGQGGASTAAPNVSVLTDSFYMPQLGRYRRVWVYLPPDYANTSYAYPVLYLHDGQNVFDAHTSFSGEWEVDETLNALHASGDTGIIVVAVDNGSHNRLNEYSPWVNPSYGGGQGGAYVDWLVQNLKPHIDSLYRTRSGRTHTGIMGSSMGGLISLYGGIEYQSVFGKIGSFSPAYWFSASSYAHVAQQGRQAPMRIYQLIGLPEGAGVVQDLRRMADTLAQAGFDASEVLSVERADGQHSEWFWAREFAAAYLWLFRQPQNTSLESPDGGLEIALFPNPVHAQLQVRLKLDRPQVVNLDISDTLGRLIQRFPPQALSSGPQLMSWNLDEYPIAPGFYFCRVQAGEKSLTLPFRYQP